MSMHGSTRSVLPGEHTLAIRAIGIMEGRQENSDLERSPDVLVERLDVAVGPHGAPRVLGLHDLHTHLRAWLPAGGEHALHLVARDDELPGGLSREVGDREGPALRGEACGLNDVLGRYPRARVAGRGLVRVDPGSGPDPGEDERVPGRAAQADDEVAVVAAHEDDDVPRDEQLGVDEPAPAGGKQVAAWRAAVDVAELPRVAPGVAHEKLLHGRVGVEVERGEDVVGAVARDGESAAVVGVALRELLGEVTELLRRAVAGGVGTTSGGGPAVGAWAEGDFGEHLVGLVVRAKADAGDGAREEVRRRERRREMRGALLGVAVREVVDLGTDGGEAGERDGAGEPNVAVDDAVAVGGGKVKRWLWPHCPVQRTTRVWRRGRSGGREGGDAARDGGFVGEKEGSATD
jgi:hypothetical protein